MTTFEEYLHQGEPQKREKGYAWKTAIGLQAVDGLKTSGYLIETARKDIEGEITIDEAERIDKERQLELAFQAERSYDVFRNGKALTRHYPGAHNAVEDIPATDYRVVYYIPESVINTYKSTGSTITQNPTSN